jgi:hypothetical protein
MRKVLSSMAEVAKCWANQSQSEGRTSSNTLYFEGESIYSYGPHYELARIINNDEGNPCALFNDSYYSPTTSSHTRQVQTWVRKMPVFHVKDLSADHEVNMKRFRRRGEMLIDKAKKARVNAGHWANELHLLLLSAQEYSVHFGVGDPIERGSQTHRLSAGAGNGWHEYPVFRCGPDIAKLYPGCGTINLSDERYLPTIPTSKGMLWAYHSSESTPAALIFLEEDGRYKAKTIPGWHQSGRGQQYVKRKTKTVICETLEAAKAAIQLLH